MKTRKTVILKWMLPVLLLLFLGQRGVVALLGHGKLERKANPLEFAYSFLASDLLLADICRKISPGAFLTASMSRSGTQISLIRSQCFYYLALRSADAGYCSEVQAVSTFLLNGSQLGRTQCQRDVEAGRTLRVTGGDSEWLLRFMGVVQEPAAQRSWDSLYREMLRKGDLAVRAGMLPDFSAPDGRVRGCIAPEKMGCGNMDDPRWFCYARRCLDIAEEGRREACLAIADYLKTYQFEKRLGRSFSMSGHILGLLEKYPGLRPAAEP